MHVEIMSEVTESPSAMKHCYSVWKFFFFLMPRSCQVVVLLKV